MAQGGQVSKAQLKRELDQLSWYLYSIDLQIHINETGQPSPHQIATLEVAKLDSKTSSYQTSQVGETEYKDKERKVIGWYLFLRGP